MSGSESVLPPLYARWLEPVLGTVRGEPRSTCERCAMAQWPDGPPLDMAFQPNVKCCSYMPEIYNYNAGRILADTHPLGEGSRATLRKRIADRVGVSPLAISTAPMYRTIYENAQAAFGRSEHLRCPHYVDQDGGMCGIWAHRDAICTTYFCKYERGAVGRVWWRTVQALLQNVEWSVTMWLLGEAGLDEETRANLWSRQELQKRGRRDGLDEATLANTVNPGRYRKEWGNFFGREEEFFLRCAEIAGRLDWDDIQRLGGTLVTTAVSAARHVKATLDAAEIPERVHGGPLVYMQIRKPGEVRVRHQGVPLDWLDVPAAVADQVRRFEAGPVRDILAAMQAEGLPIDEALLHKLLDWQVLVKA